jgi:hypothetical protein
VSPPLQEAGGELTLVPSHPALVPSCEKLGAS